MFKTAFATLFTLLMFMGSLSRLWSLRLRTTTSPNYSLERTAASGCAYYQGVSGSGRLAQAL
jgi:hypothetical protein